MTIAILIIQALILLVCFQLLEKIQNIQTTNSNHLDQQIATEKLQGFKHGSIHTWSLINISLFKMWTDSEILDFDSLYGKLSQTIQDLSINPKKLEEWETKYKSHVEERKNDGNVDDF
jgi:hypothetical protein